MTVSSGVQAPSGLVSEVERPVCVQPGLEGRNGELARIKRVEDMRRLHCAEARASILTRRDEQ
jgi:hypothetical protein